MSAPERIWARAYTAHECQMLALVAERDALKAEIERLRAALARIDALAPEAQNDR